MNYEKKNKANLTMKILIGVIILLVLFIAFFFLIQPGYRNFVVNKQIEGANLAVQGILSQIQSQGFTQLPVSDNQTVVLAYVTPEELQFLNQVRQQQAPSA